MSKKIKKTIEMRTKDAASWLGGLRSGKYKRTTGTLFEEGSNAEDESDHCGHCCLGVMQDVLGKVQKDKAGNSLGLPTRRWLKDHKIKVEEDADSLDAPGKNIEIDIVLDPPYAGVYGSVSALNDSGKFSFKQIANILDKRIKRV